MGDDNEGKSDDAAYEQEEDEEDEKDIIIKDLEAKLKEAEQNIELLQDELLREKLINNTIIGLKSKINISPNSNEVNMDSSLLLSPESPLVTCAQRSHQISNSFNSENILTSGSETTSTPVKLAPKQPVVNSNDAVNEPAVSDAEEGVNPGTTPGVENTSMSDASAVDLAPLHNRDLFPSKKLGYVLNSLKNVPEYRSTLLIGDSNTHCVNQGEIDPTNRSVATRSISGLCVVSASHALKSYSYSYSKFKKVIYSIGTNDFLHKEDHCEGDWVKHLIDLVENTKRIFPRAHIHVILPFSGVPEVPQTFIKFMEQTLKSVCPQVKRHHTPSMHGHVRRDGVHLAPSGAAIYRDYLVRTFTKHQPVPLQNPSHNSPDSHYYANDVRYGPSNTYTCYSEAAGGVPFQNNPPQMMSQKEVPTTMDPIITNAYTHPLHLAPNYPPPPLLQQPPVQQIHRPKVDISVADMMEALASVVAVHLSNKPSG